MILILLNPSFENLFFCRGPLGPPFESRRGPELWLISKNSCHLLLLWHLGMKKSRERGKFDLIKSAMRSPWNVKKVMDLKKILDSEKFQGKRIFFWYFDTSISRLIRWSRFFWTPLSRTFFFWGAPKGPLWSPLGASKCDKFQNFVVPCSYCVIWVWKIQRKREIHYWAEIT